MTVIETWVDVFDSSGNKLGDGPVVSIFSVSVDSVLDGAGSFNLSVPATDRRANVLLTNENRVQIWQGDETSKSLIGQGIIRQRTLNDSESGMQMTLTGPDILDELTRRNTLLGRIYNQQPLGHVLLDLISLVPGWSISIEGGISSQLIDARFDGVSILRAITIICEQYGHHFRLSANELKTVEVGTFGADSGRRVNRVQTITAETLNNPRLLFVRSIEADERTEEVANWVMPVGAGEGIAALTLAKSNRTSPYPIQTVTAPNGSTLYYISDTPSITQYGELRNVVQFKEIAPLSNSDVDIRNAANALYDATVIYLQRHNQAKKDYQLEVHGVDNLSPGDKIRIDYVAEIEASDGQRLEYFAVRGDFWIMTISKTISDSDQVSMVTVSNIDRYSQTEAEIVANAIERIELRGLKPEITSTLSPYFYPREIAPSYPAQCVIEFTNATVELQRLRFRLKTMPFRSTSQGAASGGGSSVTSASGGSSTPTSSSGGGTSVTSAGGGDHRHIMFVRTTPTGFPPTESRPYWARNANNNVTGSLNAVALDVAGQGGLFDTGAVLWTHDASGNHTHGVTVPNHTHTVSIPAHTHDVSIPNHTHPPAFGITDDTQTPSGVTVWVNGTNMTNALFGSSTLAPSGGNLDVVADMGVLTNAIINRLGGIRQQHIIEIRCSGGRGRIEAVLEVFQVIQSIEV
jgi:hypothetical protein